MLKYFEKRKVVFLIILTHFFINIDMYIDRYSKLGSRKINYERVSPKGRYRAEYYKLNQFVNFLTVHNRYAGYSMVYDNKINAYIYESPVYDGMDCGHLSFPNKIRPTIFSICFETQQLELEE